MTVKIRMSCTEFILGIDVTIIVTVSLTGSLRKGYGLTDDVASYSST
jgi:hypothetical protein